MDVQELFQWSKLTVGSEAIHPTGFDDTLCYIGNKRQIRDWPAVGEFLC